MGNTLQGWETTFQHAVCTMNQRTLCDVIALIERIHQLGTKDWKKKMMPLTIIPNGIPNDSALTVPAGLEVLILKGVTSPGEKNKDPIGTTSYG